MKLYIQGRHLRVSPQLKAYVEKKISKLKHFMPALEKARVELRHENTRNAAQSQIVEVTLHNAGHILRGEERSADFTAAVDAVLENLSKQIVRWKEKHYHRRAHPAEAFEPLASPAEPRIVKRKRYAIQTMPEDFALEQIESLGHRFFLFVNDATDELNLLYRRDDGNFGLIEPVLEIRK